MIELVSDLGGGKTTFVRGLARGFGSSDRVGSPTFTINRTYQAGGRSLYHFDFYRLSEAGIVAEELAEAIDQPQAVVAVEWGDIVQNVLPKERLTVAITNAGDNTRRLTFRYPASLDYLVKSLQ